MSDKLNTKDILALKARAHHLSPVVMIGQHGLTESVVKETDNALSAHELIKVRILGDERDERVAIAEALCEAVDAQLVQHIGKLLVLWRKRPDK
ncbi:ribosome assembly RNA-binding protein YhbY [Neisseria weixii]|uniref:ribosome assembly RNA-binding protein YhbY n=1 Tax=Neisseria weixii TaxID=1853276 RepID=UPI0035A1AF26